jgi:hypothetical protein
LENVKKLKNNICIFDILLENYSKVIVLKPAKASYKFGYCSLEKLSKRITARAKRHFLVTLGGFIRAFKKFQGLKKLI